MTCASDAWRTLRTVEVAVFGCGPRMVWSVAVAVEPQRRPHRENAEGSRSAPCLLMMLVAAAAVLCVVVG